MFAAGVPLLGACGGDSASGKRVTKAIKDGLSPEAGPVGEWCAGKHPNCGPTRVTTIDSLIRHGVARWITPAPLPNQRRDTRQINM